MSRKAFLVAILAISTGLFGQKSGGAGAGSTGAGAGSAGAGTAGSGTTSGAGINTSASQAGSPTTQGAVGGLSGQAAAGPITTPSANQAGTPTQSGAMAGPAGATGTTQANPDNLNNGTTFNNNNGTVGGGVFGGPVLSTPGASFAAPAPTAGISDAGRAGISSNTNVNPGVPSTLENSTVVYTNGAPVNPPAVNMSGAAAGGGRLINDMGPSYYSDTISGSGPSVSLGEVAAQFKAAKGAVNARMLTNDDVQKMVSDKTGVTMAKNMPPLGPGATPQNAGAQSSTAGAAQGTAQSAQSGASTVQQTPSAANGQQAGTPPPSGTQGQAGSEATAGNATTPEINQNQQSNDTQGKSRLPATATWLPLLGLLGAMSGGVGLWFRKFRK